MKKTIGKIGISLPVADPEVTRGVAHMQEDGGTFYVSITAPTGTGLEVEEREYSTYERAFRSFRSLVRTMGELYSHVCPVLRFEVMAPFPGWEPQNYQRELAKLLPDECTAMVALLSAEDDAITVNSPGGST